MRVLEVTSGDGPVLHSFPTRRSSDLGNSLWSRNARLAVGGKPGSSIPGAWQYKFYYTGAAPWPNDPLNHYENGSAHVCTPLPCRACLPSGAADKNGADRRRGARRATS